METQQTWAGFGLIGTSSARFTWDVNQWRPWSKDNCRSHAKFTVVVDTNNCYPFEWTLKGVTLENVLGHPLAPQLTRRGQPSRHTIPSLIAFQKWFNLKQIIPQFRFYKENKNFPYCARSPSCEYIDEPFTCGTEVICGPQQSNFHASIR